MTRILAHAALDAVAIAMFLAAVFVITAVVCGVL
jgi:hypothetical protein